MSKEKKKIGGYFLFMQEKKETVDGWNKKSYFELQKLCDPLWRQMSIEEKGTYKEIKNFRKELKTCSFLRTKVAALDVEDTQGSLSVKYGRKVAVIVGHVERVDKVK